MKKIIFYLLSAFSFGAFASHSLGGHTDVIQLSQYTYQVKVTLYQENGSLPAPPYVTYHLHKSNQGFYNLQSTYTALQDTNFVYNDRLISVFVDTITLNSPGDYRVTWHECCRVSYTNMTGSTNSALVFGTDFANYAVQGSTAFVPNSPPVFVTLVPGKLIAGSVNQFSVFAIDPDGDSISYEYADAKDLHLNSTFVPVVPQTSLTTNHSIQNGYYSVTNYGIVTWIPSHIGKYGNSIVVKEYRNGQVIGINRMELTYNVTTGSTIPITNLVNLTPSQGVWQTYIYPPQSWNASFDIPSNCNVQLFGNEIKDLITVTNTNGDVNLSIDSTATLEPGIYPVVVRITNGVLVVDNLLFINVINNIGTGEENLSVAFYPNPASNKIYVEFESELYSQFGLIKKMNQGWNDISELSVGIYYLYTNKTIYPLVKTDK